MSIDWNIVFMDEKVPEKQIPAYLVSNCHPGWMTPEANIYIVAQRIAAGCGGGQAAAHNVADADLVQALLHEMGHAVEFQILQGKGDLDVMRAEGFASWFETYAAQFSSVASKGEAEALYKQAARVSFERNPKTFKFSGVLEDYGRASMYFKAIVARRGTKGLMDVYDTVVKTGLPFAKAVEKRLAWDAAHFEK